MTTVITPANQSPKNIETILKPVRELRSAFREITKITEEQNDFYSVFHRKDCAKKRER
jgi:hypothetical protein